MREIPNLTISFKVDSTDNKKIVCPVRASFLNIEALFFSYLVLEGAQLYNFFVKDSRDYVDLNNKEVKRKQKSYPKDTNLCDYTLKDLYLT